MSKAVEASQGLKKFFVLVFISLLLGLFINSSLQQVVRKKWQPLAEQMKAKGIESTVPVAQFARHGIPMLGLQVSQMKLVFEKKCYQYEILINDIFVPISFKSLLRMKLLPGTADVAQLQIHFHEQEVCADGSNEELLTSSKATEKELFQEVSDLVESKKEVVRRSDFKFLQEWFVGRTKWFKKIPVISMQINDLAIFGQNQKGKRMDAKGSAVLYLAEQSSIDIQFDQLELGKVKRSLTTQFAAQITADEKQIYFKGDWAYFEGHLEAEFRYSAESQFHVRLQSRDLPLSLVNRWFDTPWTFQFMWLNCALESQSQLQNWDTSNWSLSNCSLRSPHGSVRVLSKELNSLSSISQLSLQVEKLNLDNIFKGKGFLPTSGVFKEFGELSGKVHVAKSRMNSELVLKKSQMVFSHNNKRELQIIDEMKMQFSYENGRYTISVPEVLLHEGKFQGTLFFEHNKREKQSTLQVRLNQLSFSPAIEELMLGGQLSPLQVQGEIAFSGSSVVNGDLNIRFDDYVGSAYSLKGVTLLLGWDVEKSIPKFVLSAHQGEVLKMPKSDWFFASLLDLGVGKMSMPFQQLYTSGFLQEDLVLIDKSFGQIYGARWNLTGKLNSQQGQGSFSWSLSNKESYAWEWSYRAEDLVWIAQSKTMRDWLENNASFLSDYRFIK